MGVKTAVSFGPILVSLAQIRERRRDGELADDGGVHRGAARAQAEFQRARSGDEGGALGR